MRTPPGPPSSKDVTHSQEEIRGPEIGPALRRDLLLERVRAARKRLAPVGGVPRLR